MKNKTEPKMSSKPQLKALSFGREGEGFALLSSAHGNVVDNALRKVLSFYDLLSFPLSVEYGIL